MKREAALLAGLLLASAGARAQDAAPREELDFVPPPPGTYNLQHIIAAPRGTVLDVQGRPSPLSRFTTGKVTVLSFIYTRCGDGTGCPLASHLLQRLKASADRDPEVSRAVRFVSLSFDPDNDTPEAMRAYGGGYVTDDTGLPWHFLTTRSRSALRPLLQGFGQDVWTTRDSSSAEAGALSHVLKVFLIDRHGSVREIYSTSFLRTQIVLNDIKTLLLEENSNARAPP